MLRGNIMELYKKVLSNVGSNLLSKGFMCENLEDMWFSKEAILDYLYNDDFGPFKKGWYDDIPNDFWKILGLPEEIEENVKDHINSGGEVIFS